MPLTVDLRLAIPALGSAGAAILHAAAAGIHADHPQTARVMVALAVLQAAVAVVGFIKADQRAATALVVVNLVAIAGWIVTRVSGISWIDGLEAAERPQLADSIAAAFAAVAVAGSVVAMGPRARAVPLRAVTNSAVLAGVLLVPGLLDSTAHDHTGHDHATADAATAGAAGDGHVHPVTPATTVPAGTGIFSNGDIDGALGQLLEGGSTPAPPTTGPATAPDPGPTTVPAVAWPRPWDPTGPIDFSGVPGVTPSQEARAEQLVRDTLRDLPAFADVTTVGAQGYQSIGDASTGFEHYVNYALIDDDTILDPTRPESLVYQVDGDRRTLVSAMFIASSRPLDDPELLDFAGPLMQWHVHDNLCWGLDDNGKPRVVAVLESAGDSCPPQSVNAGSDVPMVHVWIAPHECGPFAALEGHGAGQVDPATGTRADQCADHVHATP